jgi:hypothetical protein
VRSERVRIRVGLRSAGTAHAPLSSHHQIYCTTNPIVVMQRHNIHPLPSPCIPQMRNGYGPSYVSLSNYAAPTKG